MSRKIKILYVVEAPGGVERYLVTLLTKMKKYDKYEHILVCSYAFDQDKFNGLVDYIACVPEMRNTISFVYDFKAIQNVRKVIKKYAPDVVYCHSSKAGAIGRLADLGIRNKILYNAHGWAFNMKSKSERRIKLYKTVEKILALMTDKIVCVSEYEKQSALKHKICKPEKLQVIYNGIDFNEYSDISCFSKKINIPSDAFVVGTVGRLTTQKAPDTFVKMAIEVKRKIEKAFFVMVGDGRDRIVTEEQIKKAGMENSFLITGWVDAPLDYVRFFDVATLLSRWEGFGLVLPEYMLMNKPIVATRVDAIPEVVGDAGLIVNCEDYRAAAESVIRLYKNKNIRNQIIDNGKKNVQRFNAQRVADEHMELFRHITNKSK